MTRHEPAAVPGLGARVLIGITPGDQGGPGGADGRDLVSLSEAAMRGGLHALILREPHLDRRAYVTLARRLAPTLGRGLLLHGKHPDALEVAVAGGWGLHLPAGADLREARRRIHGLLGASCHNALELAAARRHGCDYATFSPIFETRSKRGRGGGLGLEVLSDICAGAALPVIALGGIDDTNAASCIEAGASGVAAIGAIFPPDATPESCERAARLLRDAVLSVPLAE